MPRRISRRISRRLFALLGGDAEAEPRLLIRARVDPMLLLPLRCEVLGNHPVEVTSAEVAVTRGGQDRQPTLDECDDAHGRVERAHVDECHVRRLVGRHVRLVDPVRQRG